MKNPFEKETHSGLIVGLVIGSIVAAGLAYLFFTEQGEEILAGWKHKAREAAKDIGSGIISDKTGINKKTVKKAASAIVK